MFGKLLILALALVGPSLASRLPYIIGGVKVTDPTKHPWQGSLRSWGSHSCGCALISSTWAVTAAHCGASTSSSSIRFGSLNRSFGGQLRNVNQVIIHERYNQGPGTYPQDIALLKFSAVSLSSSVAAIQLASSGDFVGNKDCYITGWGYTDIGGGSLPRDLMEANVDVFTNSYCKQTWGSSIIDSMVCVGIYNKRGSCNGDSGGPLVCRVLSSYQLVGVTSWGNFDCHPRDPSIYTRITSFRDWVRGKTGI